jgi:hypothetical protein
MSIFEELQAWNKKFMEAVDSAQRDKDLLEPERKLADDLRKAFRDQTNMFLDRMSVFKDVFPVEEADKPPVDPILKVWDKVSEETKKTFSRPITLALTESITKGAKLLSDQVKAGLKSATAKAFNLANPRAVAYLKEHGADNVTRISEVTRGQIQTVLEQGREQGWSYDRTAYELKNKFKNYYDKNQSEWEFDAKRPQLHIKDRASLIAVTEIGNAYEFGSFEQSRQMQEDGLPQEKYWSTAGDDRVSEGCAENEAAGWIDINDPFPSGDDHPLRFPGCRCACQYRMKGEK